MRIRLARWGCSNRPFYRVVAASSRSPWDGKHLDILGYYNPLPGFIHVFLHFLFPFFDSLRSIDILSIQCRNGRWETDGSKFRQSQVSKQKQINPNF